VIHTADNTTKRFLLGALALVLVLASPLPTTARTDRDIHVSLPPAIVYAEPPQLIVLPETYVYVVPDLEMDVFFYGGWWWRPWEGRWYRSRSYDTGWSDYNGVPTFYREIPSTWRNDYREHRWRGHRWDIQPIPHQQVQQNWSSWEKTDTGRSSTPGAFRICRSGRNQVSLLGRCTHRSGRNQVSLIGRCSHRTPGKT